MPEAQRTVIIATSAVALIGVCIIYLLRKRRVSSDSEKANTSNSNKKKLVTTQESNENIAEGETERNRRCSTPSVVLTQSSEDGKGVKVLVSSRDTSPVRTQLALESTAPAEAKPEVKVINSQEQAVKELRSENKNIDNSTQSNGNNDKQNMQQSDSDTNLKKDFSSKSKPVVTVKEEQVTDELASAMSNIVKNVAPQLSSSTVTEDFIKQEQIESSNARPVEAPISSSEQKPLSSQAPLNTSAKSDAYNSINNRDKTPDNAKHKEATADTSITSIIKTENNKQEDSEQDVKSDQKDKQVNGEVCQSDKDTLEPAQETRSQSGNGNGSDQCHSSDSGVSVQSESEAPASKQAAVKDVAAGGDATRSGAPAGHMASSFEFDFPTSMCGLLIGSRGKHIKNIMKNSSTTIALRHKMYDQEHQVCTITGDPENIKVALRMIKDKFPPKRNRIDYSRSKPEHPMLSPEMMQLSLPEGVSVDVIVSSVVTANHVFLQQPTHPSYPHIQRQNQFMATCYADGNNVPELPRPIEAGVICAAPMYSSWFRGQVVQTYPETDECDIRFVDYGGYMKIAGKAIRQIRSDFTTLPFQAVECYLAHVIPPNDAQEFSLEANALLEQLVQNQVIQAEVVGHESDGVPYVLLYVVNGDKVTFVNRELVNQGMARWVEMGV